MSVLRRRHGWGVESSFSSSYVFLFGIFFGCASASRTCRLSSAFDTALIPVGESICDGLLQSLPLVKEPADFEPKCLWMVKIQCWRLLSTPDNGTLDAPMDPINKHFLDSLALEPGCPGKAGARALSTHITNMGTAGNYHTSTHTLTPVLQQGGTGANLFTH